MTKYTIILIPLFTLRLLVIILLLAPHSPYQEKIRAFVSGCAFHTLLGKSRSSVKTHKAVLLKHYYKLKENYINTRFYVLLCRIFTRTNAIKLAFSMLGGFVVRCFTSKYLLIFSPVLLIYLVDIGIKHSPPTVLCQESYPSLPPCVWGAGPNRNVPLVLPSTGSTRQLDSRRANWYIWFAGKKGHFPPVPQYEVGGVNPNCEAYLHRHLSICPLGRISFSLWTDRETRVLILGLKDKHFTGRDPNKTMLKITDSLNLPKEQADQRIRDFDHKTLRTSNTVKMYNNKTLRTVFE